MNTEIGYLIQLLDKRVRNCVTDFLQEYQANGVPDLAAVVQMQSFDKVVITLYKGPIFGASDDGPDAAQDELFIPMSKGGITAADLPLLEEGDTEIASKSITATYDPIHYADVEENAKKRKTPNSTIPKSIDPTTSTI